MSLRIFLVTLFFLTLKISAQQKDDRTVVGVSAFTCDENSRFVGLVTEKVVEMLTNTKRFRIVDRTSMERVKAELELQKSEAFIDSKNLVEQGANLAAEKLVTGHITKIPVYAIKNSVGTVNGYKASVAFQMKVVDVSSGLSSDATSFEGKASDLMLSPESAVQQAMKSVQNEINQYFKVNFPLVGKIVKVLPLEEKNTLKVLLNVGKNSGINAGDKFSIATIEMIENQKYPQKIGVLEILSLAGENLSEAIISDKKTITKMTADLQAGKILECTLIINN